MKKVDPKYYIIGGSIVVILILTIFSTTQYYRQQPNFVLNSYIKAVNNRDYEKVVALLEAEIGIVNYNQETLSKFLKSYFDTTSFVKLVKKVEGGKTYLGKDQYERMYYQVQYIYEQNSVDSSISLVRSNGKWRVIFPFKLSDVQIYTPIGTDLFVDGQKQDKSDDGNYVLENVLPGKHIIQMQFPNKIQNDYVQVIQVPEVNVVKSPYETVQVTVQTPKNMIVTLAGEKRISPNGYLVFENVLEGVYPLQVTDPYGHFETQAKQVHINRNEHDLVLNEIPLSAEGEKKIENYFSRFYQVYKDGISSKSSAFLTRYVEEGQLKDLVSDYEAWFITSKNVQESSVTYDINAIELGENGMFKVEVDERVTLKNKENDLNGKDVYETYQIIMQSDYLIEPVGESYLIQDKIIQDSIVSYLDLDGTWIAY